MNLPKVSGVALVKFTNVETIVVGGFCCDVHLVEYEDRWKHGG